MDSGVSKNSNQSFNRVRVFQEYLLFVESLECLTLYGTFYLTFPLGHVRLWELVNRSA